MVDHTLFSFGNNIYYTHFKINMPAVQTSWCLKPFLGKKEKLQVLFVFVFFPPPIMPQIPFSFSSPLSYASVPSVYLPCPSVLPSLPAGD